MLGLGAPVVLLQNTPPQGRQVVERTQAMSCVWQHLSADELDLDCASDVAHHRYSPVPTLAASCNAFQMMAPIATRPDAVLATPAARSYTSTHSALQFSMALM
jgi:hypothetical protein